MKNSLMVRIIVLFALLFAQVAYSQTANLKYKSIKKELSGRYSHGSHTQASWLMGEVNLEIIFGELYGRAILGQRFQWIWKDNATYHGLTGGMMTLEKLKQYPDLYNRFIQLKPTYIRFTVPADYFHDTLHDGYKIGTSKFEIELVDKDISNAVSEPFNMGAKKGFRYFSPEWHEFDDYVISEIGTRDLRYIGRKRNQYVSTSNKKARAIDSEFNLTYSQTVNINPAALEVDEIRWPDVEMQNIFREFIRNEYKSFKATLDTSRASLAKELDQDADAQAFWLGVNINLSKYETESSSQDRRLAKTLKAAKEKQNRQRQALDSMQKRANLDHATFRHNVIAFFKDPNAFPPLFSTNVTDAVTKHTFNMRGTIKVPRNQLRRVRTVVNDILSVGTQRDGSTVKSVLLYNYGVNEVKLELQYKDGMKLVHRQRVTRSGDKIPLRATLIWDFDNYDYDKSDVDIALSKHKRCRKDDFLVFHGEKTHSDKRSRIELDIDNQEGFGPENISVFDGGEHSYAYFCITNHTSKVPAKVKVVVFKNEIITQVGNDYIWEYGFDAEEEREWLQVPGLYDLGDY